MALRRHSAVGILCFVLNAARGPSLASRTLRGQATSALPLALVSPITQYVLLSKLVSCRPVAVRHREC